MSLYNHKRTLDASFSTMIPPGKSLRSGLGRNEYPGGVPYLTPGNVTNPNVNMVAGDRTNGRVQTSFTTRTADQGYANKAQFVWLDVQKEKREQFLNLQSLNFELARLSKPTDAYDTPITKGAIIDRFKLYGVISNNDTDRSGNLPSRTFTFTIWGASHVLDYWSNRTNGVVRPLSTCYFILKKMRVTKDTLYMRKLNNGNKSVGVTLRDQLAWDGKDEAYVWQVVPFHNNSEDLALDDILHDDGEGALGIAHYWKVGHVHEYPDISNSEILKLRDDHAVSRHMTFLHEKGAVRPFQFYLDISSDKTLI